jgi:O-methyltransferase
LQQFAKSALRSPAAPLNQFLELLNLRLIRGTRSQWFNASSPEIIHSKVVPGATYSPWRNDQQFISCYNLVKNNTMVDIYRCFELWQLARQIGNVPGDILEVGVWRGGTGCLLAKAAEGQNKTVYLADTFTGVVKAGARDTSYSGGEFKNTSLSIARDLIESMELANVTLLPGIFPDDTAGSVTGSIALLHCDVDVYQSAKDIVDWAKSRIHRGGMIVFDDYGFYNTEGVTRLVNELRECDDWLSFHNLNGHAILVKRV